MIPKRKRFGLIFDGYDRFFLKKFIRVLSVSEKGYPFIGILLLSFIIFLNDIVIRILTGDNFVTAFHITIYTCIFIFGGLGIYTYIFVFDFFAYKYFKDLKDRLKSLNDENLFNQANNNIKSTLRSFSSFKKIMLFSLITFAFGLLFAKMFIGLNLIYSPAGMYLAFMCGFLGYGYVYATFYGFYFITKQYHESASSTISISHPDRMGGYKFLGDFTVKISILVYLVLTSFLWLAAMFFPKSVVASIFSIIFGSCFILIGHLIGLWSIHGILSKSKELKLNELYKKIEITENKIMGYNEISFNSSGITSAFMLLALNSLYLRAEKMLEWPIDFSMIYKVVMGITVSSVPFIVKIILQMSA